MDALNKGRRVKIMLLCEGTFPYVKGGVSSWIYQLIKGLPHIDFGVVFLGASRKDYKGIQYEFPENLVYLSSNYLFEDSGSRDSEKKYFRRCDGRMGKDDEAAYDYLDFFHGLLKSGKPEDFPESFKRLDFYSGFISKSFFLHGRASWNYIESRYFKHIKNSSFTNYFWTIRNVHIPIWKIVSIVSEIPGFDIAHAPSIGYAGFLGALLKFNRGTPFIITEHGLYIRERKIDILNSDIVSSPHSLINTLRNNAEHLKGVWINFFEDMGRFCYGAADRVVSLFEEARKFQIGFGADAAKTIVVPNGVDVKSLSALAYKRKAGGVPMVIALIGRIVPIKDIKTFINAVKLVSDKRPDVRGWIVGP